jgi:hypothetical protein
MFVYDLPTMADPNINLSFVVTRGVEVHEQVLARLVSEIRDSCFSNMRRHRYAFVFVFAL